MLSICLWCQCLSSGRNYLKYSLLEMGNTKSLPIPSQFDIVLYSAYYNTKTNVTLIFHRYLLFKMSVVETREGKWSNFFFFFWEVMKEKWSMHQKYILQLLESIVNVQLYSKNMLKQILEFGTFSISNVIMFQNLW